MTDHTVLAAPRMSAREPRRLHVSDRFDDVMARIAEIAPMIREDGQAGEDLGQPTDRVLDALRDIGVFRAIMPREVGGLEFSPRQQIHMMETLAWHEAATAWTVLGVVDQSALVAAYVDDVAIEEYYGEGRCAIVSGQGTRPGKGKRVDGGYIVSGEWQFNSGSSVSTHIETAIIGDDGRFVMATLPKEQVVHVDNWDVLGLRASSSHDYRVDDVFVADTHTYDPVDGVALRGGAVFDIGLAYLATLQHAGWALGVCKRLLEEIRLLAEAKSSRRGVSTSTDQFYAAYASMEAQYRGARAFLLDLWGDIERTVDAGKAPSVEQISLMQLGTVTANRTAQSIANEVAVWAGTALIRKGAIQRFFRDAFTGVEHLVCSPPVQQAVGKQLAGRAAEGAHWIFYDLIEPSDSVR